MINELHEVACERESLLRLQEGRGKQSIIPSGLTRFPSFLYTISPFIERLVLTNDVEIEVGIAHYSAHMVIQHIACCVVSKRLLVRITFIQRRKALDSLP